MSEETLSAEESLADLEADVDWQTAQVRQRPGFDLSISRALWNRTGLALDSDEVLAQLLDRGELEAWRELYRLASGPSDEAVLLLRRILRLCQTVPLSFPHLFIAAMGALGERVDPYPSVPSPADDLA